MSSNYKINTAQVNNYPRLDNFKINININQKIRNYLASKFININYFKDNVYYYILYDKPDIRYLTLAQLKNNVSKFFEDNLINEDYIIKLINEKIKVKCEYNNEYTHDLNLLEKIEDKIVIYIGEDIYPILANPNIQYSNNNSHLLKNQNIIVKKDETIVKKDETIVKKDETIVKNNSNQIDKFILENKIQILTDENKYFKDKINDLDNTVSKLEDKINELNQYIIQNLTNKNNPHVNVQIEDNFNIMIEDDYITKEENLDYQLEENLDYQLEENLDYQLEENLDYQLEENLDYQLEENLDYQSEENLDYQSDDENDVKENNEDEWCSV